MARLNVRGNYGERKVFQELPESVIASIEFMVAKCHRVEPQLIECFGYLFATVEGVEQSSLKFVSGIDEQAIVVCRPLLVDYMLDACVSAIAPSFGSCAVGPRRTEFVQVSMNVVEMKKCCSSSVGRTWGNCPSPHKYCSCRLRPGLAWQYCAVCCRAHPQRMLSCRAGTL